MKSLNPFGVLIEGEGKQISTLCPRDLKKTFDSEHLVVLRGFKGFNCDQEFIDFSEKFGEISLWPFGKILNLVQRDNPEDHIFDHSYVPMHWDGMYREEVPEMQIFFCQRAPETQEGGRTLFTLTKNIIDDLSDEELVHLNQMQFTYERKMEFYESRTKAPLICKHQEKDFSVMRFSEPPKNSDLQFKNHPEFEMEGADFNDVRKICELLYHPKYCFKHEWMTGDIVLADNFSLLHGREAFRSGSHRHIQRIQVLGKKKNSNPHLEYTL